MTAIFSSQLNVCILSSNRLNDQVGGIETFVDSFCRYLIRRGASASIVHRRMSFVRPVIVSTAAAHIDQNPSSPGVYPLPFIFSLMPMLYFSLLSVVAALRLHKKRPFTLIHAQDLTFAGLPAVIAGKLLNVPVITQAHGFPTKIRDHRAGLNQTVESLLIKTVCSASSRILVSNPEIKQYLISEYADRSKVVLVGLGVDLREFSPSPISREHIRSELNVNETAKLIGFIGAFREEKNLGLLLEAFRILQNDPKLSDCRLILVGSGYFEREARDYVSRRKIQNKVIFLGFRRDVGRILNALDVVVIPSFFETFSLVLIEAMACGRAIIASDIPAIRSKVKNGYSAQLINPRKVKSLEESLELLLLNDSYREELGRNARKEAQSYDIESVFTEIMGIYAQAQFDRGTI